jgi:hypothetical protein
MNKSELKKIIRLIAEEVMKDDFAPLGVAQEWKLDEKAPPKFPKKLHDKLLKQYKDDEGKAYATMWKIFHAKNSGNKKINEMWKVFESGSEVTKTTSKINIPTISPDMSDQIYRQDMANRNKKKPSLEDLEDEADRKRGWSLESKNQDHDETDMNNPEEKREVELAKKAKAAAEEILKMHGK